MARTFTMADDVLRCPHCQQTVPAPGQEAQTLTLEKLPTETTAAPSAGTDNQQIATAKAFSPPGLPLPGRIGRFAIRRMLGEGGFGIVYEAYDPQLDRAIALKVAKLAGDREQRSKRFLR